MHRKNLEMHRNANDVASALPTTLSSLPSLPVFSFFFSSAESPFLFVLNALIGDDAAYLCVFLFFYHLSFLLLLVPVAGKVESEEVRAGPELR
jgi:hypothetical protein